MSTEQNKRIVERFAQQFKNEGNHDIVDELFAPDFVHHFPDPRLPAGTAALRGLGATVVAAFPDVKVTVEELIGEGDLVVERTTARATHTGEFQGVPATGKPVQWTETHVYRLKDGKIAELWPQIDLLSLLAQIGALPG